MKRVQPGPVEPIAAATVQYRAPPSGQLRLWRGLLSVAVTVAFVWFLLSTGLLATLPQALGTADGANLLAVCAGVVATHLLRAWRLALCVEPRTRRLTRRAFVASTWHSFWLAVLPARMGEVSIIVALTRRYGKSLAEAVGLLVLLRLLDLLIICAIGGIAAWWAFAPLTGWAQWRALLGAGGAAAMVGVVGLLFLCLAARAFLPSVQSQSALLRWTRQAMTAAVALSARRLTAIWLVSAAMWMSLILAFQQCLLAVEAVVPLATAAVVGAAGVLSFAMPINGIASVGPFEGAWTATATAAGLTASGALAAAIIVHALLLVVTSAMLLPAILLRR